MQLPLSFDTYLQPSGTAPVAPSQTAQDDATLICLMQIAARLLIEPNRQISRIEENRTELKNSLRADMHARTAIPRRLDA